MSKKLRAPAAGIPIAAHMGLFALISVAAAFILATGAVLLLPPRPPDAVRADQALAAFEKGYKEAAAQQSLPRGDSMRWRFAPEPKRDAQTQKAVPRFVRGIEFALAQRLGLSPEDVVFRARLLRSEAFVFRVSAGDSVSSKDPADPETSGAAGPKRDVLESHIVQDSNTVVTQNSKVVVTRNNGKTELTITPTPSQPEKDLPPKGPPPPNAPPNHPPGPPPLHGHGLGWETKSFSYVFSGPGRGPPPVGARPDGHVHLGHTPPLFMPPPRGVPLVSGFEIQARLPDGNWISMRQGRNWDALGWSLRAALAIGGTLAILAILAWAFAGRLARPIQGFAEAVQLVGVDPSNAPVAETGPKELRAAAAAINAMQARLRVLVADRTRTLAAFAHDMRTPLMRVRLASEPIDPDLRDRIGKELSEVEALIASFIAFARDDPAEEQRVRLDLSALIESLAADRAETGQDVAFEGPARLVVTGQSLGLKRLFSNLLDNALKYGVKARASLRVTGTQAEIDICDEGPGVPQADRERIFEPFVRLDQESGGAGLGLAAARSIARAHGGDIQIVDSDHGACFRVRLPL